MVGGGEGGNCYFELHYEIILEDAIAFFIGYWVKIVSQNSPIVQFDTTRPRPLIQVDTTTSLVRPKNVRLQLQS